MKKIAFIIIGLVLAGTLWHYRFAIEKYGQHLPQLSQSPLINEIKQDISTPPPLIGNLIAQTSHLTAVGVIEQTNLQRQENGNLPALAENAKLDQAAELKLQDMFKQQYFEHVNPEGVGPGDLARKVTYTFLSEGENLAMGYFKDDKALVDAWMNSPGHRANILNVYYTEIGVAVGKGTYQGKETWMAVQEFGRPASDCPVVSSALKNQIAALKKETQSMEQDLQIREAYLQSTTPKNKQEADYYNQKVDEYNAEAQDYNSKVEQLKGLIADYNSQVNNYNACLEK